MSKHNKLSYAIALAAAVHEGQFDKAGQPYILHPLKVMNRLLRQGEDWEVGAIGVLHDAVEDSSLPHIVLEDIRRELGERVAAGVEALTKKSGETYNTYLQRVKENVDAIKVKLKDLEHNSDIRRMKSLTQADFERTIKYQKAFKELSDFLKHIQEE